MECEDVVQASKLAQLASELRRYKNQPMLQELEGVGYMYTWERAKTVAKNLCPPGSKGVMMMINRNYDDNQQTPKKEKQTKWIEIYQSQPTNVTFSTS